MSNEEQSKNGFRHTEGNASGGSSGGGGGGRNGTKSSSPKASPSSWNNAQIHRGRSRTRGVGSNRDERNGLRRFVHPPSSIRFFSVWLKDRSKRISRIAFFVWEGVQRREAVEDHSRNGFGGLWFRGVRQ